MDSWYIFPKNQEFLTVYTTAVMLNIENIEKENSYLQFFKNTFYNWGKFSKMFLFHVLGNCGQFGQNILECLNVFPLDIFDRRLGYPTPNKNL